MAIKRQQGWDGQHNIIQVLEVTKKFIGGASVRGQTTVTSGTQTITVSTTNATSGSPIYITPQTDVASDHLLTWTVNSVVDGVSFGVTANTTTARDAQVNWFVMR